ncbi:MAG: hypothetical protein JWP74_695 [Marmoricola sp.]|nr:hypothetical protein [Marmoricola sp.]
MARPDRRTADLRSWVGTLVRSGLGTSQDVLDQVVEAVRADLGPDDAADRAARWIAEAEADWVADAATWPDVTDYDRLQRTFAALDAGGIAVLQGCIDHWAARDLLAGTDPAPRGVAWFTPPDVWHAVDEGMLEVNLWHGSTANAAPGDQLLGDVIAAFAAADLEAHFDEGRIEVSAFWQRRPSRWSL